MPRDYSIDSEVTKDWWWVFDPRLSLRARAALVVGGSMLALVILLAWIGSKIFARHLESHLGPTFEAIAFQVSERLDRQFHAHFATLELVASTPELRQAETMTPTRRALLEAVSQAQPDFAWVGFVDLNGNVIASTQRVFEGGNVADAAWFKGGRSGIYAARVHAMPELARLANESDETPRFIDFAVPVTSTDGRVLGVLGASVRMPPWRDVQPATNTDQARRAHFGVTVYGPANELLLDTGATGWTDPPGAPSVSQPRGWLVESTGNGYHYFTGYMRARGYREFPGLGWLVTVRQPVSDALAPAAQLQREIVAWGLVLSAALATVTWWFAARLVKRMAVVAHAAKRIREGDRLAVLPHPGGDSEMDRMCAALDHLVEELRAKNPAPNDQPPASANRPW